EGVLPGQERDQPDPFGLLGVDRVTKHQEPGGVPEPDQPRQQVGGAHVAAGVHTRKSAASAMTAPAPAAMPCTAAMMGTGQSRISLITSPLIRVKASSSSGDMASVAPMISLTSPPEQNARPFPRMTSTRVSPRCGSSASRSR